MSTPKITIGDMVDAALVKAGGEEWLYQLATGGIKEKLAFAGLIKARMPLQITGKDGEPIQVIVNHAVIAAEERGIIDITPKSDVELALEGNAGELADAPDISTV